MIVLLFILFGAGIALLTLFAYVDRLYTEMGKFYLVGVEDNLEVFEREVEPGLKLDRGRAGLIFALLTQMMILYVAVLAGYVAFAWGPLTWGSIVQTVVLLVLTVLVFAHLVPHVLITRTAGTWLLPFRALLRAAAFCATPAVAILSFSFSVATLGAQSHDGQEAPTASEHLESIIERTEEEGLIEKEDRRLIQSAVEFGDKTVRETMTPRPNIVAVDRSLTLDQLLRAIQSKPYSRIPVYAGDLDHIEGFVYTRDLIQLEDRELKQMRAGERLRPVLFVPETKPAADLLREMRQQNIHVAIVIDEYGTVAGLATIEDLVEELVGEIHDEAESRQPEVELEAPNCYVVKGTVSIDRLGEWFGVRPEAPGDVTTLAGLLNSVSGHVPQQGEVIEFEGLRFEVLAADSRKVDRVRVCVALKSKPADQAADEPECG
jgi:CBS domain containing-hemolysin-like protein